PFFMNHARGIEKTVWANVDMYSGLVYRMLKIPEDLYTPLFAVSRMAGWSAHRMEELLTGGRIIRPAYKALPKKKQYVPIAERI
ncbi:MAG: citrate synthase, partial [Oscillospiraceae bacterium]|nr:citrate synthase [Oscillospiraceae bacterium]